MSPQSQGFVPVSAEVRDVRLLSPRVRSLSLRTSGEPLSWRPGQYLEVRIPGDEDKWQPFSIANAPNGDGTVELAIARDDTSQATSYVYGLTPGSAVTVRGPRGSLIPHAPVGDPVLMVAVGTGVAPFRAWVHHELARGTVTEPLILLFGVRTKSDLLYRDELEALARSESRFRYVPTLSRPDGPWAGRTGYVQAHLEELVREAAHPQVYVCGKPAMVTDVTERLATLGHPPDRLFTEVV